MRAPRPHRAAACLAACLATCSATAPVARAAAAHPPAGPVWPARAAAPAPPADTAPAARPRAVELDEGYERRLAVHRWGSYAIVPLFAAQYALGARLLDQKRDAFAGRRTEPVDGGLRTWHAVTAGAVGAVFAVNTVTGVWNLAASRGAPGGGRRTAHAATMLLAEAGFVATGLMGRHAVDHAPADARRHRTTALASMGVAAAGASIMWLRRD